MKPISSEAYKRMRFERRLPRWPYAAGLVLLLLLTIAAPWSWRRLARDRSSAGDNALRPAATQSARHELSRVDRTLVGSRTPTEGAEGQNFAASSDAERGPILPPLVVLDMRDSAEAVVATSATSLGAPIVHSDEYDAYAQVADYSAVDDSSVDYSVAEDSAADDWVTGQGGTSAEASAPVLETWAGPRSVAEMVAPTPMTQPASSGDARLAPEETWRAYERETSVGSTDASRASSLGEAPPAPSVGQLKEHLEIGRLLALRDRLLAFLEGAAAADASANEASTLPPSSAQTLSPSSAPSLSQSATPISPTSEPLSTPTDEETSSLTASAPAPTTAPAAPLPSEIKLADVAPASRVRVESEHNRLAMVPSPSPPLSKTASEPARRGVASTGLWLQRPEALVQQLEGAGAGPEAAAWKASALSLVEKLGRTSPDEERADRALEELSDLAVQGFHGALKLTDPVAQRTWLRSSRAVSRRLTLWRAVADPQLRQAALAPSAADNEVVRRRLEEVERRLTDSAAADWRVYLQLQELADLTSIGGDDPERARRAAARETLTRMAAEDLTPEQREFVADAPCSALANALRAWATGTVDLQKLAAVLERYEGERVPHDASMIAEAVQRLHWSDSPRLQEVARELDSHYRNANVRLAASNDMFNRLLPQNQSEVAPIHDRLAGADVHGRSKTDTRLQFRLHPSPDQWLLELEARGNVHSRTYSDAWPTRLRNAGKLEFQARKMIRVSRDGVDATPAVARARGSSSLVGVDTKLDPIPLVSDLFKGMARSRHRERQPAANAQAKSKVAEKARQRLDRETATRLERLDEQFRTTVLVPLQELAVIAEPLDMHSTEQRAVMRVRMADVEQLAACTPRPVAPSDSLVSVQLHESALNNAAAGLELDGAKMNVHDLYRLLAARLRLVSTEPPDDLPGRAVIQFADDDAVSIRCDGDRIRLTLGIEELARGRDSIRNVKVHAYFQPAVNGLAAQLVRDGALEFEGPSLRTGTRMVLHGVFNKLIPKDQPLELVAARLKEDPRWADLMVTQLVIEDGWVALALGPAHPERTAWRTGGGVLVR